MLLSAEPAIYNPSYEGYIHTTHMFTPEIHSHHREIITWPRRLNLHVDSRLHSLGQTSWGAVSLEEWVVKRQILISVIASAVILQISINLGKMCLGSWNYKHNTVTVFHLQNVLHLRDEYFLLTAHMVTDNAVVKRLVSVWTLVLTHCPSWPSVCCIAFLSATEVSSSCFTPQLIWTIKPFI